MADIQRLHTELVDFYRDAVARSEQGVAEAEARLQRATNDAARTHAAVKLRRAQDRLAFYQQQLTGLTSEEQAS